MEFDARLRIESLIGGKILGVLRAALQEQEVLPRRAV